MTASPSATPLLTVENLSTKELLQDVSFELREGEILGFAGLMGAGRTEVARAVVGADPRTSGTISLRGRVGELVSRVRQQIGKYLNQPLLVAHDESRFRRCVHGQPMSARLDQRPHLFHCIRNDAFGIQPCLFQFDQSSRDTGYVEQVVDQPRHMPDLAGNDATGLLHSSLVQLAEREQVASCGDGRQRIAQFVCQHGEKFIFLPACVPQRYLGSYPFADVLFCHD